MRSNSVVWELDEDQRDRLGRLRDSACWALDYVGRDSEEADLLRLLRGNIKRAYRLLGMPGAARVAEARRLLDEITLGFSELMIVRPDALDALGVSLADV